jgi:dUTP pyrophosphatase
MPHGVGTVDMDYTKEIMVLVYNFTEKVVVVPAGTAIAQLVFAPIYRIPTLPIGGKREGGFGSTDGGIS